MNTGRPGLVIIKALAYDLRLRVQRPVIPLPWSSIIWYQPQSGNVLRMGCHRWHRTGHASQTINLWDQGLNIRDEHHVYALHGLEYSITFNTGWAKFSSKYFSSDILSVNVIKVDNTYRFNCCTCVF